MSKREMTSLEKFIINILNRRGWSVWPPKHLVLEAAKRVVMIGKLRRCFYKCSICKGWDFTIKQVEVHHLEARIDPVKGFNGLEEWIARTFVGVKSLAICCKSCHHEISASQNETRREVKKGKGKKDDKDSRPKQTRQHKQGTKKRAKRSNGVASRKLVKK